MENMTLKIVSVIAALILSVYSVSAGHDHQLVLPIAGRSLRWDQAFINQELRHKRQNQCQWQTRTCTLGDVTRFDALGRRNSGLLVDVGSQGTCGNCWAYSTTHTVQDSRNIQAGRKLDMISIEYPTRCAASANKYGYGCCGGSKAFAMQKFRDTGTVSETCIRFTDTRSKIPDSVEKDEQAAYKRNNPLSCPTTCDDGFTPLNPSLYQLNNYKCYIDRNAGVDDIIKNHLDSNRFVTATIEVPENFGRYKCGIYCQNAGVRLLDGLHAMEIVDYGTTDTGVDFWVLKNSWGNRYGESGYWRVRRGQGDLGIGTKYSICVPLLAPDPTSPASTIDPNSVESTCSPVDMENPTSSITSMSALEFALQALTDGQVIQCPSGVAATRLNLITFIDADIQIVAGAMLELMATVNVEGCQTAVVKTIELTVNTDLDGTFSLTDYSIMDGAGGSASSIAASFASCISAVAVVFLLNKMIE